MRRLAVLGFALLIGSVLLIGVELFFALRREFIREGPPRQIEGAFGDPAAPAIKFAVLGDSTSVGLGTTPERSFPWLLAEWLGESFRVDLKVFGFPGARIADVADQLLPRVLAEKPDLVLVEIGANDATHVTPSRSVQTWMGRIIDELKKAGIKVVVAGPPDMGTSRAFAEPLRSLSGLSGYRVQRAIESVVERERVPYVDLAAGTREAFEQEPEKHYSRDRFHPGAAGYELWARTMFPTVLRAAEEIS